MARSPFPLSWFVAGTLVYAASTACSETSKANYAQAAVGLAVAVPAVLIEREITGDCYGNCSYGTECNHATGLCEPIKERAPSTASSAPSLDERCTFAERDWAQNSTRLGAQHPEMLGLKRVIEKCFELRNDPDGARVAACGTLELDLAELLGSGRGAQHPDVLGAQKALDRCVSTRRTPGGSPVAGP